MTTKDYVYLGLVLLTALAFYCNGFYAGVYRCKRMYDTLLDDEESEESPTLATLASPESDKFLSEKAKVLAYHTPSRDENSLVPKREMKGDFGNN